MRKLSTYKTVLTCLLIFLFSYTAIDKLINLQQNVIVLSNMPFVKPLASYLALIIPLLELFTVLLLMIPNTNFAGLYCSLLLMVAFTVYLVAMLTTNNNLPCTWGGVLDKMSWKAHLVFNMVITAMIAVWIITSRKLTQNVKHKQYSNHHA